MHNTSTAPLFSQYFANLTVYEQLFDWILNRNWERDYEKKKYIYIYTYMYV